MKGSLPAALKAGAVIYSALLIVIIVTGLTGCDPQETESMPHRPPLALDYRTSAEAMYTAIRVENERLSYTFFNDSDHRCAQWFKSTPCWTENDLETRERMLTDSELAALYALVEHLRVEPLQGDTFGEKNLRKRAYTETLTIHYGQVQQQLRYRSSPQAEPKPGRFAALENRLRELAATLLPR